MTAVTSLLDTDILSALLRKESAVTDHAKNYLATHQKLTFSAISYYEILRGLRAKKANRQLEAFDLFCGACDILPVTAEIADCAAQIFSDLKSSGVLIGDADILIAATAVKHSMSIVTNNERHFRRISLLNVQNWLDTP